ncbi:uncharacterized protein LOC123549996 [Mercenaria mercenaria]|uniref:uncharacterized protein LOC123549996 n=1 Tax=Mercenaria mercenaria TaxID=6596 RepID=UPI00234F4439|nr:uncharacterized protein LOC123549996 [Mercenaria mercenaria]
MLVSSGFLLFVLAISGIHCDEPLADIIARLKALENKVERQNDIISRQAMQIEGLQETVSAQMRDISELTEKVSTQENDKKKIMKELSNLKEIKHSHELCMAMVKTSYVGHHKGKTEGIGNEDKATGIQRVKALDNTKKRFVLDTLETVAFEATISGATKLPHSHVHDRVVFETVSLNVGSSYHAGNGTFIAPISGIYIFSTSLMMLKPDISDHGMHVIIEKNGMEVAGAYAAYRGTYEHSSVTAAIELQSGDNVFVSVERHDDISFYGDNLTSFMGFLLYPY